MVLDPSNSSNLEQLALKGLKLGINIFVTILESNAITQKQLTIFGDDTINIVHSV